jgi:hypothetical protein
MGSFKHQVLGEVKGKVGNVIGRRRKNKYFIYAAPAEVKISNSPAAIKSRNIMKPVSKFASAVNSIPELKYLWLNSKIVAFDAFHKIEKENFHFFIPERPTINNFITPIESIKNPISEGIISERGIKLKLNIDKEMLSQFERANEITGVGVICYFNPTEGKMDYFNLKRLRACPIEVKNEGGLDLEIAFNEEERRNYNSYLNSILYFTLVSKDSDGVPVKCTINYQSEFVHEISVIKESFPFRDSRA